MSQNGKKYISLMTSLTKKRSPNKKCFFHCSLQDMPIFLGFEQLSGTMEWRAMKLQSSA